MANNHTKPKAIKIVLSIIAVVIAASGLLGFISLENARDMAEIEKVIKESVIADHILPILPEPYCSDPKGKIPAHVKQVMFDKITAKYNEIYTSDSAIKKSRIECLKNAVSGQEPDNFRELDGGIKKFDNLIINLNGDRATAEADIRTYARGKGPDGKISTPEGTAHYRFSFAKEAGCWKISYEEFNFLPGEEP